MAGSNTPPTLVRGTNNTGNASQNAGITPSRLLLNTDSLRNDLQTRNLYTPNNLYPVTEKNQAQNIINAVNGIASIIAPFKSYNLKNTVYGRLLNPAEASPLTKIGLAMLGKQFAMNAGSHIAQQNFPVIKVSNLFDGAKNTHLFTKRLDVRITKKPAISNFQSFLNAVVYYFPAVDYPFTPNSTEADYIKNSGTGQLSFLYSALNNNVYKQGFASSEYFGQSILDDKALLQYSGKGFADTQLLLRSDLVNAPLSHYRSYFNYFKTNPYSNILPSDDSISQANTATSFALNTLELDSNNTQEYAPTADFVEKNFGVANIRFKEVNGFKLSETANEWINTSDEFGDDAVSNKLVWGMNGISPNASDNINKLLGTSNHADEQVNPTNQRNVSFRAYSGLLEYTRNLLNASDGAVVDITRKAFQNKNKNIVGFNGSGLWVANDSDYAMNAETAGLTGVRQHSMLDQYDRFAKAIRFEGNYVYGGNENSVIYDRVMPRIHPTLPPHESSSDQPNNRNLMFSIENLAVRVISKDSVGIIDDEYGSQIPICEVGQFNGRLMWFPPYNLEINESTQSNFDKTVMVGRNEPMYNYMHSERSATLNFTMLIDYPQQLKNATYKGTDKHRAIAEFFAFGGDPYSPAPILENPAQKQRVNDDHIEQITGPVDTPEPEVTIPEPVTMVFPNDLPKDASESSQIVDTMYLDYEYQIMPGSRQQKKVISSGFNQDIFFVTGMTKTDPPVLDKNLLPPGFSQYNYVGVKSALDKKLNELFKPVGNRRMFGIKIVGAASKLNDSKSGYNYMLGRRRAQAARQIVLGRLEAIFPGEDISSIQISIDSVGATGANPANSSGKTQKEIEAKLELPATTQERYATIEFRRTREAPPKKIPPLSYPDTVIVAGLRASNQPLVKSQNSNNASQCVMSVRKEDAAMQKGFQSVESNYYNPVFHTQTPEDFHKRLTFLQQCMRQGAAKRYDVVDEAGIPRAKNSVFGRQPVCILRVGDFFFTKVIIENLSIDYAETTWDMNPEGFGMQPMIAKVTLQMKVIGGQSLKGPIDALQNAITFNYYANSNFTSEGLYNRPWKEAENQQTYMNGILKAESDILNAAYIKKFPPKQQ
jgi:hypothetical protein